MLYIFFKLCEIRINVLLHLFDHSKKLSYSVIVATGAVDVTVNILLRTEYFSNPAFFTRFVSLSLSVYQPLQKVQSSNYMNNLRRQGFPHSCLSSSSSLSSNTFILHLEITFNSSTSQPLETTTLCHHFSLFTCQKHLSLFSIQ